MTTQQTFVLAKAEADELPYLNDTYIEQWSARLAAGWSPISVLWAIENACDTFPGLGLTFEPCEGACGRSVHGSDPAARIVLCPECRAKAVEASERYIAGMIRARGRKAAEIVEEERSG
jgi:hypothetical protein